MNDVADAMREIELDVDQTQMKEIRDKFSKFRHLTSEEQDRFMESIRNYPKAYSIALQLQQQDEESDQIYKKRS